jgi:hypothetical protein
VLNHIWVGFDTSNIIFQNVWFVAAIWMALALVASLISIRVGISVALVEIFIGVVAGNFLHLTASNEWINFLALLGSGVLTFLAGAEIDPRSLKTNLHASLLIGVLSFAVPFGVIWLFAQFVLGWPLHQAQIAGIALSTTSVAVVYAVMIEGGFSDTAMGKMILAACFITDFGTVLALGGLFANYNLWLLVFVVTMCVGLWFMPAWTKGIIDKLGATRVSEPEVKFIFFVLFFLGGLATTAKSEAVLPAYLVGLVVAGVFLHDKTLVHRMRSIAFAVFTPFYFIKAWALRFTLCALAGSYYSREPSSLEDADEDCRRLAIGTPALHASPRSHLHHVTHGDRPHFRHDLCPFRLSKQDYRSTPIHNSGHSRNPERVCAHAFCAKVFSTEQGCDARVGPAVSPTTWRALSRRLRRSQPPCRQRLFWLTLTAACLHPVRTHTDEALLRREFR